MLGRILLVGFLMLMPSLLVCSCHPRVLHGIEQAESKKDSFSTLAEFGITAPEGGKDFTFCDFKSISARNMVSPERNNNYAGSLPDYEIFCEYNKSAEEVCSGFVKALHAAGYEVYRADFEVEWPGQSSTPSLIGLKGNTFVKVDMYGPDIQHVTIELTENAGKEQLMIMEKKNYRLITD
jgi:hypothetical protein